MALTLGKRRGRIRRAGLISTGVLVLVSAVVIPVYTGASVHSPTLSSAEKKVALQMQTKKKKTTKKKPTALKQTLASKVNYTCNSGVAMRADLDTAATPQIRKLAEYEKLCGSRVFSKMSFFMATPTTTQEADEYASYVAKRLFDFASHDVSPLVFFEPSTSTGVIDLKRYGDGAYDTYVARMFSQLKAKGITDTLMGTWVPVPEGNAPLWSSLNPTVYTRAVTKSATMQKKYFPGSRTSLLLDSTTYGGAEDWSDGRAISLAPYVRNIPKGLIDSFGLQGFPWVAAANSSNATNGLASNYLRSGLAIEAARILGVSDVWMNTGTFSKKYVGKPGKQVSVPAATRTKLLLSVVSEARKVRLAGFNVSIHLFAENKSAAGEATDWSYWPTGAYLNSPSIASFKRLAHESRSAKIGLWLYDTLK